MAARYPAPPANAAVSDGVVGPGETFTFSARGFRAGEPLIIRVTPGAQPASTGASIANGGRSVPGKIALVRAAQEFNATADSNGAVSMPLTISEPGVYTITATGLESDITSAPVTVTVVGNERAGSVVPGANGNSGAGLANTGARLANTGADSSLVLWSLVGGGALVAGAASVVVVRRRANAEASA